MCNQYAVLRWQVKNADVVLEDGIMPIVDYFRVYGNGRYLGKTKMMSFCLKRSRKGGVRLEIGLGEKKKTMTVIVQPVTIFGSSTPLTKCNSYNVVF